MRAIMESGFSVAYLVVAALLGVRIFRGSGGNRQRKLFGLMTIILVCGDAFHLVPRILSAVAPRPDYTAALGFGTLVTSITMTAFYVMLYYVWRERYSVTGQAVLTQFVLCLAAWRVILCLHPGNRWLSPDAPWIWGVNRNIPFAILGIVIIVLFYKKAKEKGDRAFRFLWLAVLLSFAFYIPVVLWADFYPLVGMLMLPKTCAYVWLVWMGYKDLRPNR
jgi:hypothetical protein